MPTLDRQLTRPVLLDATGKVTSLEPVTSAPLSEDRLQELLGCYPGLLPVEEIEPAFHPLILLGREVPCEAGFIDLLYTSPMGYLTVVETKLWKNPEARRKAVAQIIDYASELATWDYDDLDRAVKQAVSADGGSNASCAEILGESCTKRFMDTVSRNLRRGNHLLIIAGDGIREGVERIAEYVQGAPHLMFNLALVELALYDLKDDSP